METLPKEQLLLKLLKMTTSTHDTEALVAIRKANELLVSSGWNWDKLIEGKIRVVENPFANIQNPLEGRPPPKAPTPAPPPPKPKPTIRTTYPIGNFSNRFPGHCYCCGIEVIAGAGFIFHPSDHNVNGSSRWHIVCATCNTTGTVWDSPQTPVKKRGQTPVSDLA